MAYRRPMPAEIRSAAGKRLPDVLGPGLEVLFCGINPSLYSAAVGHHFARPGNRFWPALHHAGFTPRVLSPFEDRELLGLRYGITNIVNRATARADELSREELLAGARALERKLLRYRPRWFAVLGIEAFRKAFGRPDANWGPAKERIVGTPIWVLPNPSGLNAAFPLQDLVRMFRELHRAAGR